jgi:hypothetical protein
MNWQRRLLGQSFTHRQQRGPWLEKKSINKSLDIAIVQQLGLGGWG